MKNVDVDRLLNESLDETMDELADNMDAQIVALIPRYLANRAFTECIGDVDKLYETIADFMIGFTVCSGVELARLVSEGDKGMEAIVAGVSISEIFSKIRKVIAKIEADE